jgi:EpsI family protein
VSKLAVAIAFLTLNAYVYHFMARNAIVPPRETFAAFPLELADWRCAENEPLAPEVIANLGATDTLVCNYVREGHRPIGLYVGYHATQIREEGGGAGENSIHPPAHCLPGSGWDIVDSRTVPIDFAGLSSPNARAKRLVIAKGQERQLVYYWYQMGQRSIAEDWQKILYVGYDRATHGRTDGALVRFTIPFSQRDADTAESEVREFASHVVPLLPRFVPN